MPLNNPVIKKIKDNVEDLNKFKLEMNTGKKAKEKLLIQNYPVVYIHVWKKKNGYEVYVGETNNIFRRTEEHYRNGKIDGSWQSKLKKYKSELYIIGH